MKNFSKIEKLILKNVYLAENGLEVFTLFRRIKITMRVLIKALKRLEGLDFLITKEYRVSLTKNCSKLILSNPETFLLFEKYWRNCPEEFKVTQILVNQPYIPRISKLDKKFLTLIRNLGGKKNS